MSINPRLFIAAMLFTVANPLFPMHRGVGSSSQSFARDDEADMDIDVDELKEAFGELTLDEEAHQPCHICYDPFFTTEGNTCQTTLLCGHAFHGSCIRQWTANNAKCPVCRNPHASLWLELHDAAAALRRGNAEAPDRAIQALSKIKQIAKDFVKEAGDAATADADRRAIRKMLRHIMGFIHDNQSLLSEHEDFIGSLAAGTMTEILPGDEGLACESLAILCDSLPAVPRVNYYTLRQLICCTQKAQPEVPRRLRNRTHQLLLPAVRAALEGRPRDADDRPAHKMHRASLWNRLALFIQAPGSAELLPELFAEGLITRCALEAFSEESLDTNRLLEQPFLRCLGEIANSPQGAEHVRQLFSEEGVQRALARRLSEATAELDYAILNQIWCCFNLLAYHTNNQARQLQEVWQLLEDCNARIGITEVLRHPVTEGSAMLQNRILCTLVFFAYAPRTLTEIFWPKKDSLAVAIWQILRDEAVLPSLFRSLMEPTNSFNAPVQKNLWLCLRGLAWANYNNAKEIGRLLHAYKVNPTYEDKAITAAMRYCREFIPSWKNSWCTIL